MSEQRQKVLEFIQQHGPSVPNEVRQGLALKDNFLTGALLSELLGEGLLAITHFNHGTSKVYYDASHPETLETVNTYLGEKDRRAFELLKAEQVVRPTDLTPLMRVAIASIKDFSRQLILQTPSDGEQEFYYYYLLDQEEAIKLIKKKFFGIEEHKEEQKQPEKTVQEPKKEQEPAKPEQKIKKIRKPKVQMQQTLASAEQKPVLSEGFAKQVHDYFDAKQIGLLQVVENKKTELTCIVSVASSVGTVQYFCKAKAKKTASEGDLAAASLEAQSRKLPLLYICAGTLTKKAQDMLQKELKGTLVVQPWA